METQSVKLIPADGHPYRLANIESGGTEYWGFVGSMGNWYIMQVSAGQYRYAKGNTDYTTNWTNRAGLTYGFM